MITVTVKAIMHVATVLGSRQQQVVLPDGSRLSNLLEVLEAQYGRPLTKILYKNETKELDPLIQLMLNGRNIVFGDGLNSVLKDGDELFFLPPIGGG